MRAYETLRTLSNTKHRRTSIIEDSNGIPLAEDSININQSMECCNDLYNHQISPAISILKSNTNTVMEDKLIHEEIGYTRV